MGLVKRVTIHYRSRWRQDKSLRFGYAITEADIIARGLVAANIAERVFIRDNQVDQYCVESRNARPLPEDETAIERLLAPVIPRVKCVKTPGWRQIPYHSPNNLRLVELGHGFSWADAIATLDPDRIQAAWDEVYP